MASGELGYTKAREIVSVVALREPPVHFHVDLTPELELRTKPTQ